MGIWAIVPVKHLKEGKSSLESVLSPRARELFSCRLLKRTLGLLALSDIIERTVVISRDDTALQMARELGALIVNESSASDLNCALQRATQVAASLGATGVLVLPSDLPLLGANDVEEITRVRGHDPIVVLAADRHGSGTNAIFVRPPGLFRYRFGGGSLVAHQEQARVQGVVVRVYRLPGMEFDVDEPADLHRLQLMKPEFRDAEG